LPTTTTAPSLPTGARRETETEIEIEIEIGSGHLRWPVGVGLPAARCRVG
jgi:hypothetical protein